MKHLSFELTMPNVGSWNGKWSGQEKKYYVIKSVSDKYFKTNVEKLLNGKEYNNWYYNFGDGWGANVRLEVIDTKIGRNRKKISAGFCGYEWMIDSILKNGKITTD